MRIIAHRGASVEAPENTLVAFERAIGAGADAIEFDVRLTRDGYAVIAHDDEVIRATGVDARIASMTLDDVRALDAGATWGWDEPLSIPTLDEVLDLIGVRVPIVVELKGAPDPSGYQRAVPVAEAIIMRVASIPGVVVSSFDPAAVETARRLAPSITTAVTGYRAPDDDWMIGLARAGGHGEVHVPQHQIDAPFVDAVHAAGLRLATWTVNERARADELEAMGVDAIFSDDPRGIRR